MNLRDIQLLQRHWLVLAASILLSGISIWALLAPEDFPREGAAIAEPSKLMLAPTGMAISALERPVFNKARSAVAPLDDTNALGLGGDSNVATLPPVPPPQLPTLVGLATGRGKAIAIIKGADGTARNVSVGDNVDGWTIISISRAGAKLSVAGITQNITLNYGNQQGASSSSALASNMPSEKGN